MMTKTTEKMPSSANDIVTGHVFGTTKGTDGNAIATGHLLRETINPTQSSGQSAADRTSKQSYNALGEVIRSTDPAGGGATASTRPTAPPGGWCCARCTRSLRALTHRSSRSRRRTTGWIWRDLRGGWTHAPPFPPIPPNPAYGATVCRGGRALWMLELARRSVSPRHRAHD